MSKKAKVIINNKDFEFPILSGSVGPDVLDIGRFFSLTGNFTLDPGITSTASCESSITYIDGEKVSASTVASPWTNLQIKVLF